MIEKIVIAILSMVFGILICRLFNHIELHSLKDQLLEAEQNNESIIRDNADLSRQNDVLRRKIWELEKEKNIPKFGD